MESVQALKAVIIGGTGAVGRELVEELIKSPKWSLVTVIARRKLEDWDKFSPEEKQKLQILQTESLDSLQDTSKWDLNGYSTAFCCLGAYATEVSKAEYEKVNCTYPENFAKLAAHFKIPHYSLTSGMGIESKSWMSNLRVRGEMEDRLPALQLPHLSIFKPGGIYNRKPKDRFIESFAKYMPFLPKITAHQVGLGQRIEAELQHSTPTTKNPAIYSNAEIIKMTKTGQYP